MRRVDWCDNVDWFDNVDWLDKIDRFNNMSGMITDTFDIRPSAAPLFGAFLDRKDFGAKSTRWKDALAQDVTIDAALVESLIKWNRNLGASDAMLARLQGTTDGSIRTVITGQQPGVLGGPLMTVYKIATAVAVARRIEEHHDAPCVPIYWLGADDVDFAEIRDLTVLASDLTPITATLATDAYHVGMPVGDISAEAVSECWKVVESLVADHSGASSLGSIASNVLSAANNHNDHGVIAARMMMHAFAGEIIIVDGRDRAVRRATQSTILEFFDEEFEIQEAIARKGSELEQVGHHAQLKMNTGSGVFLMKDGKRHKVASDQRPQVRAQLSDDIGLASPGVVLRNLVQDAAFSPVAVVLGPAEVAYREQIGPAYERLGISMPISFPRMFATWIPPQFMEVASQTSSTVIHLATDLPAFKRDVFVAMSDPETRAASEELERQVSDATRQFEDALVHVDEKVRNKLMKKVADLSRRAEQVVTATGEFGRQRALEQWPFIAHAGDLFRQNDRPQERYLSWMSPYLSGGEASRKLIVMAAANHVDAAMDETAQHIVYSI